MIPFDRDQTPRGSGEARPVVAALTEVELTLGDQMRQGPCSWRPDEVEPSKRRSHALDRADESMLMVISSSSLGTLVLVPDSNP